MENDEIKLCQKGDEATQCDQIGRFIGLWTIFKAFGNNYFVLISHILRQFL